MKQILIAIKTIISKKWYLFSFLALVPLMFLFFVYIPVVTIPGNDLGFQLSIYSQRDYILMFLLAALVGLNFLFQIYSFKKQKEQHDFFNSAGQVAVSGVSGVFGAIVGTAACVSCLAFLFGLIGLGTGSVFFVLNNQTYFLVGAIALMLVSLYFTARKVNGICEKCT